MNPRLEHEFDEDYLLARRFQREEEALRRQEEERNQLALKKFLAEEERVERRRKQSQLENSHMECFHRKESELVDYKSLLQQQKEDEENLELAMKFHAEEVERERRERERQKYEDERFAAQMMLMQEETIQATSVPAVASARKSSICNDNDDHMVFLKIEKEERMKMIVRQMFKEHAKFERISRRRSRRMIVASFETPTSLVFAASS